MHPTRRFLPEDVQIYGFARSELTDDTLRERVKGYLKGKDATKDQFLQRLTYCLGASPDCGCADDICMSCAGRLC